MYACDFEYDGLRLSDFGFIICKFDAQSGIETTSGGSKITFNTVSRDSGKKYSLTSTRYDEFIETSFDICKNPSLYEDISISDAEYKEVVRWLNRRGFYKFHIIDEDNIDNEQKFYNASFNIEKYIIDDTLYGLSLTMTTNAPFGYGSERIINFDIEDTSRVYAFIDTSDEIGYIYPSMIITCKQDGDLTIYNETENSFMEIKGCSAGEVITIDGDTLIPHSSIDNNHLCKDFNFEFLRIGNSFTNRINKLYVNKPCKIKLKYFPIIKDAPI